MKTGAWYRKSVEDTIEKVLKEIEYQFLFNTDTFKVWQERDERRVDAKWAYIKVGNTRKRAFVTPDKKTAYKEENYSRTEMQWPRFTFERWLRFMDV